MNAKKRRLQRRQEEQKMSDLYPTPNTNPSKTFTEKNPTPLDMTIGCYDPMCAVCYPYMAGIKSQPNKKEEPMNTAVSAISVSNEKSQEAKAFDRILNRMREALSTKDAALLKEFGMVNEDAPRTPKALVQRILDGLFVIPETYEDQYCYNPSEYITWRDPNVKKDKAGYEAARKVLDKKYEEVVDNIYVSTVEEGLKVFNKFENSK